MTKIDTKGRIQALSEWIEKNSLNKNNFHALFEMLKLGQRGERNDGDPVQYPSCYYKDNFAKDWHDPNQYSWVSLLEENYESIKKEAVGVFNQKLMDVHPENNDLAGYGTWNTFFFYKNGEKYLSNHDLCPITSNILKRIPGVEIAGRTYFSAMAPGIHIKPHCGPHNFKLRTHLGLVVPEGAIIRVADTLKPWTEGKCIVFDDSFEHEVWNKSEKTRIVLIVDVWNPCLSAEEIKALEYLIPELYQRSELL